MGPNLIPNPHMRRKEFGQPITTNTITKWISQIQISQKNIFIIEIKVTIDRVVL